MNSKKNVKYVFTCEIASQHVKTTIFTIETANVAFVCKGLSHLCEALGAVVVISCRSDGVLIGG